MPQYDWAKMSARERDALVAEKVMGFQWVNLDNGNEALIPPMSEIPWCLTSWHTYDTDGYHQGMPQYTTDISAVLEVVGKALVEDEIALFHLTCNLERQWHAVFNGENPSEAYGDTAPEAISLCLLRVNGVDV